jgi:inorganic pyrophosphatase
MSDYLNIPLGEEAPDIVTAVIEIPQGSVNKYEYNKKLQVFRLDRNLHSPVHYPAITDSSLARFPRTGTRLTSWFWEMPQLFQDVFTTHAPLGSSRCSTRVFAMRRFWLTRRWIARSFVQ